MARVIKPEFDPCQLMTTKQATTERIKLKNIVVMGVIKHGVSCVFIEISSLLTTPSQQLVLPLVLVNVCTDPGRKASHFQLNSFIDPFLCCSSRSNKTCTRKKDTNICLSLIVALLLKIILSFYICLIFHLLLLTLFSMNRIYKFNK